MKFATFAAALNSDAEVRVDTYEGQPHVVAPVVAVQESVLKGAYLPGEEIQAAAAAFNDRPLPVGHPTENGEYVSAATPERVQTQSVGRFYNVEASTTTAGANANQSANDGGRVRLLGETWVSVPKSVALAENDPVYGAPLARLAQHLPESDREAIGDALDALPEASREISAQASASDSLLEVSTAYFFDPEESAGSYNGEEYAFTQRHLRPDHLALLPHQVGECSIEDGCGAPRANDGEDGTDATESSASTPTRMSTAATGSGQHSTMTTRNGTTNDDDGTTPNPLSAAATAIGRFAHNCVCGCGGACHDSNTDTTQMDPEMLAEQTGISLDVLEAMSEEDRDALAGLAEQVDDDGADPAAGSDGDGDGQQTQTTSDSDGADPMAVVSELREELEATRSELSEVRETVEAQSAEERAALIDRIEPNSALDRDALESLDTEVLEGMAADYAPQRADYSGRVGVGGGVGSTAANRESEERVSEAASLAAQLSGRAAPDGGHETGGDDE